MTWLLLAGLALGQTYPCTADDVARCTRAAVELRACLGELAQAEEAARLCLPALEERDQLQVDLDRALTQRDRARARTRVAGGAAVALGVVLVVAVAL
jgi:hypothetical protein